MEYIFSMKNGSRVMIGEEGNNILVNYIYGNRIVRSGILYRNYRFGLCCKVMEEDVYIAYISIENELVWDKLGSEMPIMLYADKSEKWSIDSLKIINLQYIVVLFYKTYNQIEGVSELKYIMPYEERQSKILLSCTEEIEEYQIIQINNAYYIWYTLATESNSNIFIMNVDARNGINIKECFIEDISAEVRMEEQKKLLEQKLKDKERELEYEFEKQKEMMREDYANRIETTERSIANEKKLLEDNFTSEKEDLENRYKKEIEIRLHNAEQSYKKQYDELVEMTREIQEEGKKWRELYYKSVKKK